MTVIILMEGYHELFSKCIDQLYPCGVGLFVVLGKIDFPVQQNVPRGCDPCKAEDVPACILT